MLDFLKIELGDLPQGRSEYELKKHIQTRKGVHLLKTNAAACLQGLLLYEPDMLTPEAVPTFLTEMVAAGHDPEDLARQILVEQVVLSQYTISNLLIEARQQDQPDAKSAYIHAISKLQAELRRNLKHLCELRPAEKMSLPVRETIASEELVLERFSSREPQPPSIEIGGRKISVSELGSNDAEARRNADPAEALEPATSRCGQAEPHAQQRPFRGGPAAAPGSRPGATALGEVDGAAHGRRKTAGGPQRSSRPERISTCSNAKTDDREAAAMQAEMFAKMLESIAN